VYYLPVTQCIIYQ